jgi:V8-like Glu-specific endopeptidase
MKFTAIALAILFAHAPVYAILKVVYGNDDRVEARNYPIKKYREYAKSVAVKVESGFILPIVGTTDFEISKGTLQQRHTVCSREKFSQQRSIGLCTGFLVGKDIVATAGHCMTSCDYNYWAFNFNDQSKVLKADQVYNCVELIGHALGRSGWGGRKDYALFRLDRPVKDARPLPFRTKGKIRKKSRVFVIGYPLGIPVKIADNANVKRTYGNTFNANLDTYGGNSGSPVINRDTGLVEGILVEGENDFERNGDCRVSGSARGKKERIFKITKVKELRKLLKKGEL